MKKYLFALGYTQRLPFIPFAFLGFSILHLLQGNMIFIVSGGEMLGKKPCLQHNQSGYLPLFLKIQNHINSNIGFTQHWKT